MKLRLGHAAELSFAINENQRCIIWRRPVSWKTHVYANAGALMCNAPAIASGTPKAPVGDGLGACNEKYFPGGPPDELGQCLCADY